MSMFHFPYFHFFNCQTSVPNTLLEGSEINQVGVCQSAILTILHIAGMCRDVLDVLLRHPKVLKHFHHTRYVKCGSLEHVYITLHSSPLRHLLSTTITTISTIPEQPTPTRSLYTSPPDHQSINTTCVHTFISDMAVATKASQSTHIPAISMVKGAPG